MAHTYITEFVVKLVKEKFPRFAIRGSELPPTVRRSRMQCEVREVDCSKKEYLILSTYSSI